MRSFTAVISDLTPGQADCMKQEYRISSEAETWPSRVRLIRPDLDDEAIEILRVGIEESEAQRDDQP